VNVPGAGCALASYVLAVAASAALAIAPTGTEASRSSERTERVEHRSLLEREGPSALRVLAVPVVITAVPVAAGKSRRFAGPLRWTAAGLLTAGTLLATLSIGVFYLPSVALMLVAALRAPPGRRAGATPTVRVADVLKTAE
jgi:hypothetical protein